MPELEQVFHYRNIDVSAKGIGEEMESEIESDLIKATI